MARLIEWLRRQPVEAWVTGMLVASSVLFVLLQLSPSLLLLDTTPAGGDMGAHVWGPAFLREELLPRLRLSGWAPDWYAGFPAYQFYMVLPSLLIVFLDVVLFVPYNVAFKLVTVLGLLALPIAAWAMGRLARLPFPMPAALAVATVPFIFDRSFSIYGGNAASTLAGEFAFSISLAFALVFLGVVLRGLDTGRNRALAATLFALTVLCHIIPAVFAVIGVIAALMLSLDWGRRSATAAAAGLAAVLLVVGVLGVHAFLLVLVLVAIGAGAFAARQWKVREIWLARFGANRLRVWWVVSSLGVGSLIAAFWSVPFLLRVGYMTNMNWEKLPYYWQPLFPGRIGDGLAHVAHGLSSLLGGHPAKVGHPVLMAGSTVPADMTLVIVLALLGVGASIAFRRRFGIWLTTLALLMAVAEVLAPQGRLWNARLLPFWYLCLYLLAGLAVVEVINAVAVLVSKVPETPRRRVLVGGPIVAALLTVMLVAFPLGVLPFGHTSKDGSYSWLLFKSRDRSVIPSWVRWNYSGYERKDAYPEYQDVVSAMRKVGEERGCGRAMWESDQRLDRFGTPMALMLLPYWTEGCIGSMEGLYFESSATTPYHFINQTELSAAPSKAERGLPYGNQVDVPLGVDHLQLMGVKYYLAFSDAAVAQADKEPDLKLVASTGAWRVYEVAHSDLVQPLANEPVVVKGVPTTGKGWERFAVNWYLDRSQWGVMRAASGPSPWQRVNADEVPLAKPYSSTTVTDIHTDAETIKFTVNRTGAPMLIKASYFPNWKATNAEGPFRVAPNLMVVIPTDNIVTLRYVRTSVDWAGLLLTVVGIVLAVQLSRRRRLRIPPPSSGRRRAAPPPPPGPSDDVLATVGGGTPDRERWGTSG